MDNILTLGDLQKEIGKLPDVITFILNPISKTFSVKVNSKWLMSCTDDEMVEKMQPAAKIETILLSWGWKELE